MITKKLKTVITEEYVTSNGNVYGNMDCAIVSELASKLYLDMGDEYDDVISAILTCRESMDIISAYNNSEDRPWNKSIFSAT
jgi:uncharacterized protein (DUF169 family)